MELRILGGEARGRLLKTNKNDLSVRPLLGRIKKSLFDILYPRMQGSKFLDLYAGTGAVGIEALSRGASSVVFVDFSHKSLALVKENVKFLGFDSRVHFHYADVLRGLGWLNEKFDIIFLGPPYKDINKKPLSYTAPTLRAICESGILAESGLIVSQHHDKEPVIAPDCLKVFRQEKYGDTILDFYEYIA